jgi:Peptidase A4 family
MGRGVSTIVFIVCILSASAVGGVGKAAAANSRPQIRMLPAKHAVRTPAARTTRMGRTHLGLSPATLPYFGGRAVLAVSAPHAARCLLKARPAFWSGRNPLRVRCKARIGLTVPAAATTLRWTFTLTARSRSGQTTRSKRTLTIQRPPFQTSTNWAGYVVPSASPITGVTGRFAVPALNCSHTLNAKETLWVGIGGWEGQPEEDLLQTGVDSYCENGSQINNPSWWEEYPEYPPIFYSGMQISVGDQIADEVLQLSDGSWETRVDDLTTGVSGIMQTGNAWGTILDSNPSVWLSKQGNASSVSYSGGHTAEWIMENFSPPLADFE